MRNDFEYVQASISNISFPNDIDGLRYFIYEHKQYNIEDILLDYSCPQIWTVPRHSKIGDIVLFFHAKTARQRIVMLKNIIKRNYTDYKDADILTEWLDRALILSDKYSGKIFAIGKVQTIPTKEDDNPFEGQHWRGRIYADVGDIFILDAPIDISEFNDFILISRQSAITRLPHKQYIKLREVVALKNVILPEYYLHSSIGDFTLANITKENFLEETRPYRRRFLLEIDYRAYFVDFLLKSISGRIFYRECACYNKQNPVSFVDNVFKYNEKFYLLEVKLNIHIEKDLIGQLRKYITSEYVYLDNKHLNKLENFEREFMFVIDTEAIYKYTYSRNVIEVLVRLDDMDNFTNPFEL